MNTKNLLIYSLLCSALCVTSCSPDEPSPSTASSVQEFADNWQKLIGDIDPEQSWNTATRCSLNVDAGGSATISIYTKGNRGSYLVAQSAVNGSEMIAFDIPSNIKEVYVVRNSDGNRDVQTIDIATTNQVTFSRNTAHAAATRSSARPMPRTKVYAVDYNLFSGMYYNSFGTDYFNQINYPHYHEIYKSWNSDFYALQDWPHENTGFAVGEDYDVSASKYSDVAEVCANMYVADDDNITKLYPYSQNYSITTTEDGEVSLIGIYRNTNAASAIAYFYTEAGASVDEMKKADKYIIVPNNEYVVNRKFTLVYYDPANNYTPTTTFPAGTEIHFGIVRGFDGEGAGTCGKWLDWTQTSGDIIAPAMNASLCLFSNAELNKEITAKKGWSNISGTALYSTHGVNILSFEDWGGSFSIVNGTPVPDGQNSIDWNDIAFIIDGNVEELPSIDEAQSWILACEDLGDTNDFDFNDIIFSITHYTGSTTATITPLAAGGELAATIYLANKQIGEIHDMIIPGSPTTVMLNTTTRGKAGDPITVDVGENFSMAATDMGGFSIVVDGNSSQATIAAPEAGSAPQMICIDGTDWAWPIERTSITTAYSAFASWAADHTQATDWFTSPDEAHIVK